MAAVDVKFFQREDGIYDFGFSDTGDFDTTEGLDTALLFSLFEERRADPSEVSPPNKRRGWIGNELQDDIGFELGSKLWLLDQERLTQETVNKAQDYAQQAVQWLIDESIVDDVVTTAEKVGTSDIRICIELFRDGNRIENRFFDLWKNTPNNFNQAA